VDLFETNLACANLSRANLAGADLGRAFLGGANLAGANLAGTNLWEADIDDEADLTGATADTKTEWPEDFDPKGAGVAFESGTY